MLKRVLLGLIAVIFFSASLYAKSVEVKRVLEARDVVKNMLTLPESAIPPLLFQKAEAVAIFPSVYKAGLIFGGRYGKGIIVAKDNKGVWTNPVFVELISGSIGLQFGVSKSDIVLVFKTKESLDGLINSKLTLGSDISIAAGPTGREAGVASNLFLDTEVYMYAITKGLYLGVSLIGDSIIVDKEANKNFYKDDVSPTDIINNYKIKVPSVVKELDRVFN